MTSFRRTVSKMQPVLAPLFDALAEGLKTASEDHADYEYSRRDDQSYFSHRARRHVLAQLKEAGLVMQREDDDRPRYPMSALLIYFDDVAMWIFKAEHPSKDSHHELRLPGRSPRKQEFYRQDPMLDGMATDNIIAHWSENDGVLDDTMTWARPLAGNHRRDSLVCQWVGSVRREIASYSVDDLDELKPIREQPLLGAEDA